MRNAGGWSETCTTERNSGSSRSACSFACSAHESGPIPQAAEALVATAAAELATSVDELRELAHGIHPAVLGHGLTVALESLAARSTVATAVSVDLLERLPEVVEVAAYFVASEALANIAKHAQATTARINSLARHQRRTGRDRR